jgi:hypothetical protein
MKTNITQNTVDGPVSVEFSGFVSDLTMGEAINFVNQIQKAERDANTRTVSTTTN